MGKDSSELLASIKGSYDKRIDILRPKYSPAPLIRIGGNNDGAYLLPNDLDGIQACFSPGVSNRKDFEDELLVKYGIPSHMCDYSSDPRKFKTPLMPGQSFKQKWLDIDGSDDSISLENWVTEMTPDPSEDLILQMDIEGSEYRNLLGTPDAILRRFRIIVIELHRLKVCNQPEDFNKELGPLLERIDKYFLCVHAHPNNCSGDFQVVGSKLNLPNVHELTFLRRDRWEEVAEEGYFPPMIPHPLDISSNVPSKPPIFLNAEWLISGERQPESTIRLLSDQANYFKQNFKQVQDIAELVTAQQAALVDLYRLAQQAASALPMLTPKPAAAVFVDLAAGKPFRLSSNYFGGTKQGQVTEHDPFFFHTGEGRNESITIDLEDESWLFELRITNRTDSCMDRARFLFYCLHNDPNPALSCSLPVAVDERFLMQRDPFCMTNLRGARARYVTIFSPGTTMLHLSSVQIIGLPC